MSAEKKDDDQRDSRRYAPVVASESQKAALVGGIDGRVVVHRRSIRVQPAHDDD